MNRWLCTLSLVGLLAVVSAPALADRAVPDPPPAGTSAPFEFRYQRGAKYKITIPKKFLEGVKVSELDSDSGEGKVSMTGNQGRTVLAGLAFSMAVGSMVFFRRKHVSVAVMLVAGSVVMGAGSLSWADVPVPPIKSTVTIEVVDKGDTVIFVAPNGR